jgi:hypothetical protein
MRAMCGLLRLLCFALPGALRADTMYSLSGTYGSYSVSISFDTSLTGSALDSLTSDNITPTVSDFLETNTIPGNGSASLNVTISTDSLGNITAFSITDTSGQVVTNTEDSGETAGTPGTYNAPSISGDTFINTDNLGDGLIIFTYLQNSSGSLVVCTYDTSIGGALIDHDGSGCPSQIVASGGTSPAPVNASGTGTFTSNPLNPGAPAAVPEINSGTLLGTLVGLLALAAWRRTRADRKAPIGALPGAIVARPGL